MIEQFEGLRLTAYQDIGGVWTIGYGHTGGVYEGLVWTKEQADAALTERLSQEFEPAVNRVCDGVPTTQGQFDAMVCLAYNIGAGGFSRSEVAKQHRLHAYDTAADAFEHWDHVNGQVNDALHNRRVEEGQAYLDASPGELQVDAAAPVQVDAAPIGHQKLLAPATAAGVVGPVLWWARVRHGLDVPAEVVTEFLSSAIAVAVYLIPHSGGVFWRK